MNQTKVQVATNFKGKMLGHGLVDPSLMVMIRIKKKKKTTRESSAIRSNNKYFNVVFKKTKSLTNKLHGYLSLNAFLKGACQLPNVNVCRYELEKC